MRICVPLVADSVESMINSAKDADVDLVELRLDYLSDTSDISALADITQDKIVTCMPSWEGGKFKKSEEDRLNLLGQSLEFADYVTIELKTEELVRDKLVKQAKDSNVKVIIASHDFERTPSKDEIKKILADEADAGADIAKVAFMPSNYKDVLTVLDVLVDKPLDLPVIAVSMGEVGKVSRILAPLFGSYLTFASAFAGAESAPGQITLKDLKNMEKIMK